MKIESTVTRYLEWRVGSPRMPYGDCSTIETLINEEASLLARFLRNERRIWLPRIAIT